MELSIKSSKAFLWKTGYTLDQLRELHESGKVEGDWLVCPVGEASKAITIAEFLNNPSVLNAYDKPHKSSNPAAVRNLPPSVAAMGWCVFVCSLLAYFLLLMLAKEMTPSIVSNPFRAPASMAVIATILKAVEALIIASAITALLGHAYNRVCKQSSHSD